MLIALFRRALPFLQLTRMALVFTAIADALTALLLRERLSLPDPGPVWPHLHLLEVLLVMCVSVGMWGFGVSLNDIIDRRRDSLLAATRPLAAGRIGVVTAHLVCTGLGLLALVCGILLAVHNGSPATLVMVVLTLALITAYDTIGKYVPAVGLLVLGLVRFFHAAFAAPHLPLPWHGLVLLNHVIVISAIAYVWSDKRPRLSAIHWIALTAAAASANICVLSAAVAVRGASAITLPAHAWPVLAAAVAFVPIAWWTAKTHQPPIAGQKLLFRGTLWLIVLDAAFVYSVVSWQAATAILLLLPTAWLCVRILGAWRWLAYTAQRPTYIRSTQ